LNFPITSSLSAICSHISERQNSPHQCVESASTSSFKYWPCTPSDDVRQPLPRISRAFDDDYLFWHIGVFFIKVPFVKGMAKDRISSTLSDQFQLLGGFESKLPNEEIVSPIRLALRVCMLKSRSL